MEVVKDVKSFFFVMKHNYQNYIKKVDNKDFLNIFKIMMV